jgi:hypothetical protein
MATPDQKTRAGRMIRQPEGYRAFIPAPLPPAPSNSGRESVPLLPGFASV